MDKIKTGSIYDVAEVLRDLYRLKTDKQLSFGERRMLDTARTLIVKEIAIARDQTEEQVEDGDRSDLLHQLKTLRATERAAPRSPFVVCHGSVLPGRRPSSGSSGSTRSTRHKPSSSTQGTRARSSVPTPTTSTSAYLPTTWAV